jgi:agmatine deiminase
MEPKNCRTWLPPEWAPQSGVMLTWPHAHGDWADNLAATEAVFVALARHIAARELVLISCYDASHRKHVDALLRAAGIDPDRIRLHVVPSNDSWARDHGPLTVICSGEPVLLDFRFNGWGGKYPADLDNQITPALYRAGAFGDTPLETVDLIVEGGGIEVDGSGTLLATKSCLITDTRNPGVDQATMEQKLGELLGLNRFLWLEHGWLAGDDTDGHIDTLARFCGRDTIAYVSCDDATDEHHEVLRAMKAELESFRSVTGDPYRLVALPLPQARRNSEGKRLPATYANFLIINGAVLVPTYDDPADAIALARLAACFPGREIVAIDALPVIRQYGSLHCVTMQLPQDVIR